MKIIKVDHIGVAVNSIEASLKFFANTLGLKLEGQETVAEQKVTTAFM
ncbi:MAG: VOC family protein, partial [Syntrophales bacterium]